MERIGDPAMHAGVLGTIGLSRRCAMAAVLVLLDTAPLMASGVTTSTTVRTYPVPGSTAKALVGYMLRNPVQGDHGAAFANIRPSYSLAVETQERGGVCRVRDVHVTIRFSMTLPVAANAAQMSSQVRSAWNSFAAFARRHEEAHRASYIGCANRFVAAAKQETAPGCYTVSSAVRRLFSAAKRDCEVRQVDFDRQQKRVLASQRLFRMAGY